MVNFYCFSGSSLDMRELSVPLPITYEFFNVCPAAKSVIAVTNRWNMESQMVQYSIYVILYLCLTL